MFGTINFGTTLCSVTLLFRTYQFPHCRNDKGDDLFETALSILEDICRMEAVYLSRKFQFVFGTYHIRAYYYYD